MVSSLPGGIDDTDSKKACAPNPLSEQFDVVEALVALYETKPNETLTKKIPLEIESLTKLARNQGLSGNPATVGAIGTLQGRYDAIKQEANKKTFPIEATVYVHGSKESNWEDAKELGLTGEVAKNFSYTALEVDLTVLIQEDGSAQATHVNGVALTRPVRI